MRVALVSQREKSVAVTVRYRSCVELRRMFMCENPGRSSVPILLVSRVTGTAGLSSLGLCLKMQRCEEKRA